MARLDAVVRDFMNIKNITATDSTLKGELFPLLLDSVFHVTDGEALKKIKECGFITSNKENTYPSVFPQSNKNFGALNGVVCLIDLRGRNSAEAENYAGDGYYFLRPKSDWKDVVFLIIDTTFHKDLKLQARFNPPLVGENYIPMEEIYKGPYVPEIECWYPEKITLNKISDALIVNIEQV